VLIRASRSVPPNDRRKIAVKLKTRHGPFGAHARQPWRLEKIFHGLFYG
jgi:hypothetical protein